MRLSSTRSASTYLLLPSLWLALAGCGGGSSAATPDDSGASDSAFPGEGDGGADPPPVCDLVQQSCSDPTNNKCTLVDDGTGVGTAAQCVPSRGALLEGQTCMRLGTGPSAVGMDDCKRGLLCSGFGTLDARMPARHCRKFCARDQDCAVGRGPRCQAVTDEAPPLGICVPTCTLFGQDCDAGLDCSQTLVDTDGNHLYLSCRAPGPVALAAACAADSDCGTGAACLNLSNRAGGAFACTQLCDGSHSCANGKMCTPLAGVNTAVSACQ